MTTLLFGAFAALMAGVATIVGCTRCRDGWLSSSRGRGTCSWHNGIDD